MTKITGRSFQDRIHRIQTVQGPGRRIIKFLHETKPAIMASMACSFMSSYGVSRCKWREIAEYKPNLAQYIYKYKNKCKHREPIIQCPRPSLWRTASPGLSTGTTSSSHHSAEASTRTDTDSGSGSDFTLVASMTSEFNHITILEVANDAQQSPFAGSRLLLLDESNNVHSIYRKERKLTGFYWDEFASLPGIIPEGPVAILGLGGGTVARTMLDLWPSLKLEGWEIDHNLVDMARDYLGLSELEEQTTYGGTLTVHIGDALSHTAMVRGAFAGLVVDLFDEGKLLPQLQQVETWLELKQRLAPGGRIMINCGGNSVESRDPTGQVENGTWTWQDGAIIKDYTMEALSKAFPHELNLKRMDGAGGNYIALTGPFPDLDDWAAAVPDCLRAGVRAWKPFSGQISCLF